MGDKVNSAGSHRTKNQVQAAMGMDAITAVVDSSGGTADGTIDAGVGKLILPFPISNMTLIADGDLVTDLILGFAGKIEKIFWVQGVLDVDTGSKTTAIHAEIEAQAVTGGVLTVTSALAADIGDVIYGTAITALNAFTAAEKISLVAASTTQFGEGDGTIYMVISVDGVSKALAELATKQNAILAALKDKGYMFSS